MGSGYSTEQKKEFQHYKALMDKAINDGQEYREFRQVRDALGKHLQLKKEFAH
jgi:hypothetical protein